ncbi:hypothetical protein DFJ43DRAFT_1046089 [Lentinula guzmanii]|uniref:HIT-type domain-containing protein n=1 Tax=Lentinula guzmanii TaxID=2804957 RepID=A0AA38MYT0_9AGAR|nr:hypothetical protein DFJ43DRAFT_1046089 [Lentinula guzmanii]
MNFHSRRQQAICYVCDETESRYFCSTCSLPYCSVTCYKKHKVPEQCCSDGMKTSALPLNPNSPPAVTEVLSSSTAGNLYPTLGDVSQHGGNHNSVDTSVLAATPLKPLTSLKWPYIADEEPIYPDPLERNDPKPLRMRHYEAIATSQEVRKALFIPSVVPGQPDKPNVTLRTLLLSIDKQSGFEREQAIQHALGAEDKRPNVNCRQDDPITIGPSLALCTLAEAIKVAVQEKTDANGLIDWD